MGVNFEVLVSEVLENMWAQADGGEEAEMITGIIDFISEKDRRGDMVEDVIGNNEAKAIDEYDEMVSNCKRLQGREEDLIQEIDILKSENTNYQNRLHFC